MPTAQTESTPEAVPASTAANAGSYKPRAVILDLFGDYLRYLDAEVHLGHLTTLLAPFDIAPATVRVTMSRLRREGWFSSRRVGRETVYTLSGHLLDVLDDGRRRIFAPPTAPWTGEWTMVIYQLRESERQERDQLRKALAWHGFGPLSTSTWLAPGDRRHEARAAATGVATAQVDVLRCVSDGIEHDRELAARCWDLEALAGEYTGFVDHHAPLRVQADPLDGASALVARTSLIATYRHFPFKDPQLPRELQPPGWPGEDAHELFRTLHRGLGPAATRYVSEVVGRDVPVPDDEPTDLRTPT